MTTMDIGGGSFRLSGKRGENAPKDPSFGVGSRVAFGIVLGTLLVGGIGAWAANAKISGAVIGQGTVKVDQHVKEVQHRDGGTITQIPVREGDHVDEGQVLLQLDDVQIRAELAIVTGQLLELSGRRSRLRAERDGLVAIGFPDGFGTTDREAELAADETKLFEGNLLNRNRQKEQMDLQIGQLQQEVAALGAQKAALEEELGLVEVEHAKLNDLAGQGLIESSRVYAINREMTRMLGELGAIEANTARAEGRISEIRLQMLAIDETARNEAQRELRTLDASLGELSERHLAVQDRLADTIIRSPISGIVNELNVTTVGGVITPAEALVTIVPDDADLRVEFKLRTVDVDQIDVGQPAKLRLSAFNQRTTPEIDAEVVRVSAAAQRDPATGETFYLGDVEITGDLAQLGDIELVPGMPVEVFVQTQEMTAISYLAKPFTDQFARAFREE